MCDNKDHDGRFKGVVGAKNGCLACQCEQYADENVRLSKALADLADTFIAAWWDDWRNGDEEDADTECDVPAYVAARAELAERKVSAIGRSEI